MTVYAVAIGEPSFGIAAPFAVGLSLLVSVQAGGKFTGMQLEFFSVKQPLKIAKMENISSQLANKSHCKCRGLQVAKRLVRKVE